MKAATGVKIAIGVGAVLLLIAFLVVNLIQLRGITG